LLALLATAAPAPLAAQSTPPPPDNSEQNDIVVIGDPFVGVAPERSLDADLIDAYGVSTVGELLDQVREETGEIDEDTVILVNGERVSDLGDAADYPVEAVSRIDILPRGTATRVGGSPQRRVISVTLRDRLNNVALTAGYRFATEGDWAAERGEAIYTRIRGPNRINLALRVRHEDDLLESDRGIVQPTLNRPFDILGNVIPDPRTGATEIDPALSALAGRIVTVAAIPADNANPTLQSFAANANRANVTDLGQYRTLRPDTDNYQLSLSAGNRLTSWLSSTVQARLSYNRNSSLLGLPTGTFILPSANAFSPFSRDVGIAGFGDDPLGQRSRGYVGNVTVGLNAGVGDWQFNFTGGYVRADNRSTTERQTAAQVSQPILLGNAINPFSGMLDDLLAILSDTSRSVLNDARTELRATGSPFSLPAGQVRLTLGGGFSANELVAHNAFQGRRRYHRSQWDLFANGEIPLASRRNNFMPGLGELSATWEVGVTDVSDFGTLTRYAFGLGWMPMQWLRFNALESRTRRPPSANVIGDAAIVTPGVRYFDFLTGQTVDVTQVTGGNAALLAERVRTRQLSANAGPWPALNLRLNAEYTSIVNRNSVSSLPPASAAVLLAFPDRFLRDANGTLTLVDIRAVNFTRQRLEQFRYGFNFVTPIGRAPARPAQPSTPEEGPAPEPESTEGAPAPSLPSGPRPRLQLTAFHTIILDNDVIIRPALPTVDLLAGGAIGISGAPSRHQVSFSATLGARGMGASLNATWRSESFLTIASAGGTDRLRFAPVTTANLRAFVAGTRLFPGQRWLRGSRFSINVLNLLNDRQEVRDSAGATPLRYQAAYRDPLGRTIEFEFRKTF
jgi:hypothetical protein